MAVREEAALVTRLGPGWTHLPSVPESFDLRDKPVVIEPGWVETREEEYVRP